MKVIVGLFFSLLCIWTVHGAGLGRRRRTSEASRGVSFMNLSGRRVDLLWVNTKTDPVTYASHSDDEGFAYGAGIDVNSYNGHKFELREIPGKRSKKCLTDTCWKSSFVVNNQEDQSKSFFRKKNKRIVHSIVFSLVVAH